MIYVTHDQTEALTFADTVVVMHDGRVVQAGRPDELFEKPAHTFVGYFIGSPGMNVLPATVEGNRAHVDGRDDRARRELRRPIRQADRDRHPARIRQPRPRRRGPAGHGRAHRRSRPHPARAPAPRRARGSRPACRMGSTASARRPGSSFSPATSMSMPMANAWRGGRDGQALRQPRLVPGPAGPRHRRLLGGDPADDGGELFGAGHLRQQPVLLERHRLVQGAARPVERSRRPRPRLALAQPRSSPRSSSRSRCRSASWSRSPCRARAGRSRRRWC